MTETSPSTVQGVHIFDAIIHAADCTTDVSYLPPKADGNHVLCVQIALPGYCVLNHINNAYDMHDVVAILNWFGTQVLTKVDTARVWIVMTIE